MTPRLLLTSLTVLILLPRTGAAVSPADSLIGLWSARVDAGPEVRGELTIERRDGSMRARIAGHEVSIPPAEDSIRFALPRGRGEFRGRFADAGRSIEGFWIQPTPGPDERGSLWQSFATPMALKPAGQGRWRGLVVPLDSRFTLYLKAFDFDGGNPVGAFRNPELNNIGEATRYRMIREGDSLWFCLRSDTNSAYEKSIRGSVERNPERIRVNWPGLGRMLELERRTPLEAAAFFPRPPRDTAYVYRRPEHTGDGWTPARARDTGMDEDSLAKLVGRLARLDPADRRPALIHSLLVAHRGKLVLEEYFYGHDRETRHDVRSAGKTLGAVMLGAAMEQGVALAPETPVYSLLAGRGPFANPDPRKAKITLAHLMTHTAGLACNDNDDASPGNEDTMQSQNAEPDWWKYTLDLPVAHEPGTRYAYGSANTNLLGAAITAATRTWLPAYFDHSVARPLQFGRYHWNLIPTGEGYLGGGAYIRPRDLLKVGQMYLNGGVWNGKRIVDSSWVTRSTAARLRITPETTGIPPEQFGEFYGEADEGFTWHLSQFRSRDREYRGYAASGNGGQILMVVPELELAVVFTAGNYRQGGIWSRFGGEIVPREIIPAIRR